MSDPSNLRCTCHFSDMRGLACPVHDIGTNAGRGAAQEPLEGGGGSEGLDLKRERLREAADARATANRLEREADACAITHQDPERRRQATAWHRQRVRELRAYADQIDPPAGVSEPEARGGELNLPAIARACEAFWAVWRDPDAESPAFGRPVRMLLDALAMERESASDKGMTPVTYWTVKCVTCGQDAFEDTDHTAWSDQEGAAMTAADYYYELVDGAWYCEDHAPDDEAGDLR